MGSLTERIKRRSNDLLSAPVYWPWLISLRAALGGAPRERVPASKLGDRRDLMRPEFMAVYKDILAWQKHEQENVSLDPACVEPALCDEVRGAYERRTSHGGRPGRSRELRYDMIWETVWALMHLDIRPGMRVADIGAENSCVPAYLASKGCEAYGLDVFIGGFGEYFKKNVLRRCKDETLVLDVKRENGDTQKVIYKIEDASKFSFPDNFFDRIVCLSTIEHLFSDSKAIAHMGRALKPGGMLAVTTPFGLAYSQNPYTPEAEAAHKDANHIYSEEALMSRLIQPSGLTLGDHDFTLTKATWRTHHLPGQAERFVSVAFFLRKN